MSGRKNPTAPAAGPGADQACDSSVKKCPALNEPKIVSIAYLDGADNKEISTGKHFVNLDRDAKWVDGSAIKNIDRLSHKPRIKVRFNKPGSHPFTVKYAPNANNASYLPTEVGRNGHFKYQDQARSYTTDGDGTKILPIDDFFVAAAGKDKYKLGAKDDRGNKVQSGDLEIHRLFHYIEIKMKTLSSIASSLSTVQSEYAKHNISMLKLPSIETNYMANIGSETDTNTLKTNARAAYIGSSAPGKEPFVIAIAYTDHLAVKNAVKSLSKSSVQVGPGKLKVRIPVRGVGLLAGDGADSRALWKDIVPGEDWFVSAKFLKSGGAAGSDDVSIPKAKCTAVSGSLPGNNKYCDMVDVDVTSLPAGTGTVTITVNWVDRMRAGLASSGNLVIICTRAWWQHESTANQNQVMIHEIGHMIGMVADGSGKLPNQTAKQYSARGHRGSHCYSGLTLRATFASGSNSASDCVMFGSTNGKPAFCSHCAPAVRKIDICDGWPRF